MNIKITVKSVGIFFENIIIFINVINDNLVSFVIKKKKRTISKKTGMGFVIFKKFASFKSLRTTIINNSITAERTSSLWPSAPPKITIHTSLLMFHNRKVWSLDTDSNILVSIG